MKIVFLDTDTMGYDISMDPISSLGDYVSYGMSSREEAMERLGDCEVLIVNKVRVDKALMDAAPYLRLVCVAATGVNNIDMDYAAKKGILVRNSVNYSTESVAQITLMQILALTGHHRYFDDYVKNGDYSKCGTFSNVSVPFFELRGKVLGIIGLGNIGRRVAQFADLFGMKVIYFSASGNPHSDRYECVSLERLLMESDIVSIHAPLTAKTDNLVGEEQLRMMKKGAYLINMGRGGIVNEEALAVAIDEGVIAGAAVDVFVTEPLPSDHPYLKVKNRDRLVLSPHVAWASREARTLLVDIIAENIRNYVSEKNTGV